MYLEVCQFKLDFLKIGDRILLDSNDLHLLVNHILPQCSVLCLWGDTQVRHRVRT